MLIDTLESRRLMSVSLNAATHVLTIQGTPNNDAITVDVVSGKVKVTDNGKVSLFAKTAVSKILAFGGKGDDNIKLTANVTLPSELHSGPWGGLNGDNLQGGAGKDTIYLEDIYSVARGGAGDDTLLAVYGDQQGLYGEAGNDTIKVGPNYGGDNGFNGGPGIDTLDYSAVGTDLVLQNGYVGSYFLYNGVANPTGDVDNVSQFENFTSGSGNDYIYGTAGANVIKGNGGNDVVYAGGGDDKVYGGAGADALYGEAGNDFLQGDAGNDFLSGGTGADSLNGNDGNDVFYSKDGGTKDFLSGGAGTDKATRDAIDVINSVEQSQF